MRSSSSVRRCSSRATRSSFRIPRGRRAPATSGSRRAFRSPVRCTSRGAGGTTSTSSRRTSRRGRARSTSTLRGTRPAASSVAPTSRPSRRSRETHDLWLISDEAYEDVVFDDAEHVSAASLPGMYDRTIAFYTFSKTYAMTGLRLGYVAAKDPKLRDRMKKALFYTASNVRRWSSSGESAPSRDRRRVVDEFRDELKARRDLFYAGIRENAGDILPARRQRARSTRSCASTPTGPPLQAARGVALLGDDGIPDRAKDGSAAFPVWTSARTARGICASASRGTVRS